MVVKDTFFFYSAVTIKYTGKDGNESGHSYKQPSQHCSWMRVCYKGRYVEGGNGKSRNSETKVSEVPKTSFQLVVVFVFFRSQAEALAVTRSIRSVVAVEF